MRSVQQMYIAGLELNQGSLPAASRKIALLNAFTSPLLFHSGSTMYMVSGAIYRGKIAERGASF